MLVHLFHEHRKYYEIQVFSILKMCFYVYFILKYFILTFLKISIISEIPNKTFFLLKIFKQKYGESTQFIRYRFDECFPCSY